MNGANSLTEEDRSPPHLCPVCLAKLVWSQRLDPHRRYQALAEYYQRHKMEPEARFAEKQAQLLGH
jgi:archaemetzincin